MSSGNFLIEETRTEIEDLKLEFDDYSGDCKWVADNVDRLYRVIGRAISYEQVAVSAIELLNAIFPCIIARDDYRRWDDILEKALEHARVIRDDEFQMQLWAQLGQNYLQFGLRKEAYEAFTVTSERGEDSRSAEMALVGKLGQLQTQALYQKGHYKDLIPEILALVKQIDQPKFHALTHTALALGHTLRHETFEAFEHAQMSYIWWYTLDNDDQKSDTAFLMAQACLLESSPEQANRYLKLAEQETHSRQQMRKLGYSDYERGALELEGHQNPAEAEKWFVRALDRFSKLDYPYLTAGTHHALGITQTKLEKFKEARENLQMALRMWASLNNGFEQASVVYAIGFLASKQGKTGSALRWYRRCLRMLEGVPDSPSRQQLVERLLEDIKKAEDKNNEAP